MDNQQDRLELVVALIDSGAARQRQLDGALGDIKGISYNEYRLLAAVAAGPGGGAARVDLARAVGLTPSGVTRALRPLEKLGMVETVRHERDARRSLATLTTQGQELLSDARGVVEDAVANDRKLQALSDHDCGTIMTLLEQLDP